MTRDYKRTGTIDRFAAMNIATGQVLTDLNKGHAGTDVLRFFKQIEAAVPRGLSVHGVGQRVGPRPRDHQNGGPSGSSPLSPVLHPNSSS
jgi:hypothetical protein